MKEQLFKIGEFFVEALPKLVELVRQGRDPASIRLDEILSKDALAALRSSRKKAQEYVDDG